MREIHGRHNSPTLYSFFPLPTFSHKNLPFLSTGRLQPMSTRSDDSAHDGLALSCAADNAHTASGRLREHQRIFSPAIRGCTSIVRASRTIAILAILAIDGTSLVSRRKKSPAGPGCRDAVRAWSDAPCTLASARTCSCGRRVAACG